jgi:hypothetical protein
MICLSTWVLCAVFFVFTAYRVPKDIAVLREQMRQRAQHERDLQAA